MAHPHVLSATTKRIERKIDRTAFIVRPGDIIVFGSDGLFDNLNNRVITDTVVSYASRSPQFIAKALARMSVHGRKPDDITVLVGRVYRSRS